MMGVLALARAALSSNDPSQGRSTVKVGTAGVLIKGASQGKLYTLDVINTGATAYWLMVFDKATAPVNGDTPIWRRQLPASGELALDFGMFGLYCAAGIGIAISTSAAPDTLTLAGANDIHWAAFYK